MNRFIQEFLIDILNPLIISKKLFYLIMITILIFSFLYLFRLPIHGIYDTDLWYHLNGGKYFFENNEIPRSGFFSYISDKREWSNYYWMFQIFIYQIYSISGYYGLNVLKAFIFLATLSSIGYLLLKNEKDDKQTLYFLVLFILFCFGLIPRYYAFIRPHIFSYLLIPLFLCLFEFRSRVFILLPILTIFWCNMHGIEYPVIFLIVLSYMVESFIKRFKNKTPFNIENYFYLILSAISLWSILLNPYGFKLLSVPFINADFQYQYIKELIPMKIDEFLSFRLYPFSAMTWSALNILIIIASIGCFKGIYSKNIRISHLLLFVGGLFLLIRAERFRYEAALLLLPMLKYNPLIASFYPSNTVSKAFRISTAIILISLSLFIFSRLFRPAGRYPISHSHLPHGITTFLNHIDTGGLLLNNPDYGGYLQWALNSNYKIAMDLQMSLFSDEDFFLVINALNTKEGFVAFSDRFHHDFIVEKRSNHNFKELIKEFPEYRAVFFDNVSVLYINKKRFPRLTEQYELKAIDPYSIMESNAPLYSEEDTNALLHELMAIHAIYPQGMLVNFKIGQIYKNKNDFEKAFSHSDTIIENYPEYPVGYILKGDIFKERDFFKNALSCYRKALNCAVTEDFPLVFKRIALLYYRTGNYLKAYKYMKKTVDVFFPDTHYKDLWQLGNMALKIGKINEGSMLLKFALIKTPATEKKLAHRIRTQLDRLSPYIEGKQ